MSLRECIVELFGYKANSDIKYTGMSDAVRPCTISFLDNPKFAKDINKNQNIVAVFVREKDSNLLANGKEIIEIDNPKAALFELHNYYYREFLSYPSNQIAKTARIHQTAFLAPYGVILGENVEIGPHSTILPGVKIGDNTVIGANCVIGEDGFHVFDDMHGIKRIAIHDGWVRIGKYVEIHASVIVDKGFMGRDTIISDECKIDELTHVAHRAHINTRTVIAGGVDIAGSTNIGTNVWIGPHSVVSNRVTVGNNARVNIGAVVIRNVKPNTSVSGNFAIEHEKHLIADAKDQIAKL